MKLTNRDYDILKFMTTVVFPALGTLYFTLSQIWNLPYGKEVVGTIAAITTFFGVCLRVSTSSYNNLGKVEFEDRAMGQGDEKNESHNEI